MLTRPDAAVPDSTPPRTPIRLLEPRPLRLPVQDRELVPQHEDFQLLRPRRPATEDHQLEQTANDQVRKRPQHARPPPDGEADATRPLPSAPSPTEFSNPTRSLRLHGGRRR